MQEPKEPKFVPIKSTGPVPGEGENNYATTLRPGRVVRYELPNLGALNFVLPTILAGGGSVNLRIDAQGKALGQAILEMPIPAPEELP